MPDYEAGRAGFSWAAARAELDSLPNGGLNIAYEAVDRHADGHQREQLALCWLGKSGEVWDYTYEDLRRLSNRFANVLCKLGVERGARICVLLCTASDPASGTARHPMMKRKSLIINVLFLRRQSPRLTRLNWRRYCSLYTVKL